jgi:hypothetical protein
MRFWCCFRFGRNDVFFQTCKVHIPNNFKHQILERGESLQAKKKEKKKPLAQ